MLRTALIRSTLVAFALVLLFAPPALEAQEFDPQQMPSSTAIGFTLRNVCPTAVVGFAVGDELCLLKVGPTYYRSNLYQGELLPQQSTQIFACADSDDKAVILIVPPANSNAEAERVFVEPNSIVFLPASFCGISGESDPGEQLKIE
ncbi:MAG: hypothetical protein AAGD01_08530 [Acidobacteriota bacterium]